LSGSPRRWLNSWAKTLSPELSACVDVPPPAFGQWLAADLHEVQST
jgi:hypothetical protein